VIVRIMGEGQVRLDDSRFPMLDKLDDELMAEVESGDEEGFRRTLGALLDAVRAMGTPLPDDSLEPSELILPAPEASIDEVRAMLTDDGLIPGAVSNENDAPPSGEVSDGSRPGPR
jgi:PspAA-like protein